MKILVAVPTYENITPDTFKSIYGLHTGDHETVFDFVRGYDCARARNNIVNRAMEEQADYVLMVDNDVVLPSGALVSLLEGAKDVCFGFYPHRNRYNQYDGKTNLCRLGEYNYTQQYPAAELCEMAKREEYKIEIHGGGMGCALVKTEVFTRLKYPWFDWTNYADGQVLSEDLYFCENCRKAGIKIYADTRVGCGHLFRRIQWPV